MKLEELLKIRVLNNRLVAIKQFPSKLNDKQVPSIQIRN